MSCSKQTSPGLYDRQMQIELFKRYHGTNFTLKPKISAPIIGPTSYNPKTIEEIYRNKRCSKFGSFFQQSTRFSSSNRKSKSRCSSNGTTNGLWTIPDRILREKEFQRRYNSIRFDRQSSDDRCRHLSNEISRAPPPTLYEKTSFTDELRHKQTGIYGPYVQLGQDQSHSMPEWYKGPSRQLPRTMLEILFSSENRFKGKFSPSTRFERLHFRTHVSSAGPTTYFQNSIVSQKKNPFGVAFLSTTERFSNLKSEKSTIGPAEYNPHLCRQRCSK